MGFRIDKKWGNYVQVHGTQRIARKNPQSPEDQSTGSGPEHQDQQAPDEKPSKATFTEVQKAVEDEIEAMREHNPQGLVLSAIETAHGTTVRLCSSTGQLVKEMTGEEFIALRKSSTRGHSARGKVLDQKF